MTDGKKLAVARELAKRRYRKAKAAGRKAEADPEGGSGEAASQITSMPLYVAMDSTASNAAARKRHAAGKRRVDVIAFDGEPQSEDPDRIRKEPLQGQEIEPGKAARQRRNTVAPEPGDKSGQETISPARRIERRAEPLREQRKEGASSFQHGQGGTGEGSLPKRQDRGVVTARSPKMAYKPAEAARKGAVRSNAGISRGRHRSADRRSGGQGAGNPLHRFMESQGRKKAQREAAVKATKAAKAAGIARKGGKVASAVATQAAKRLGSSIAALIGSAGFFLLIFVVVGGFAVLILGSAFGIFFSGNNDGGDFSLRDAVIGINREFESRLNTLCREESYDILDISGRQADWRDVLSVYAVRISADPDNTVPVTVMDEARENLLRDIFWEMTSIRSWTEQTEECTEPVLEYSLVPPIEELPLLPEEPEEPDPTEPSEPEESTGPTEPTQIVTVLYIVIDHRTALEMASEYAFDAEQQAVLEQLLQPSNSELWGQLLYGLVISGVPNAQGWTYPLPEEATVASPFGPRIHPIYGDLRDHNGVDLGVELGTPIFAVRDGTVAAAAYDDSSGNYVVIDHQDGYRSSYLHMAFYIVGAGDTVSAGQIIGYVGSTGDSTGPHLHLGLTYNGSYLDPLAYISYVPPEAPTIPPELTEPTV